eukprot:SAG11_NODE_24508_length_372_cov_0.948718_1_plen_53_part_10
MLRSAPQVVPRKGVGGARHDANQIRFYERWFGLDLTLSKKQARSKYSATTYLR